MHTFEILEGAEEFSLGISPGGGPAAALLVHGFTGSPQSMRPLGDHLSRGGVPALGVRLPGHGTAWQDLGNRTHPEWVEAVDTGLDVLTEAYERVFVIGLSFGASLCLDLAARRPDDVAGVVALAPYLVTVDPRRHLAPIIRYIARSVPGVGNDICHPDNREQCYDRVPTAAAYSMLRYLKGVRASLPRVAAPLLVMHSPNDHTAHPSNATVVMDGVSSTDKELVWLERSYHVLTLDNDHDEVFTRTQRFIADRTRMGATSDGN